MKALPNSNELLLAGTPDAGTFSSICAAIHLLIRALWRKGARRDAPLRQPISAALSMIALIIRTIEMSIGMSGGNFQLSKAELTRFYKQGGARLAANTSHENKPLAVRRTRRGKASSSDNTTVAPSLANMIRTDSEQQTQAPGFLKPAMEMRAMKWGSKARCERDTSATSRGGVQDALKALTSGTADLTEVGQLGSREWIVSTTGAS